jgi:hypothetical protein
MYNNFMPERGVKESAFKPFLHEFIPEGNIGPDVNFHLHALPKNCRGYEDTMFP